MNSDPNKNLASNAPNITDETDGKDHKGKSTLTNPLDKENFTEHDEVASNAPNILDNDYEVDDD